MERTNYHHCDNCSFLTLYTYVKSFSFWFKFGRVPKTLAMSPPTARNGHDDHPLSQLDVLQSISRAFKRNDSVLPFSDSQEDFCERPDDGGLSFVA